MAVINKNSNTEIMAWVQSAITHGQQDHDDGNPFVPLPLLELMRTTHQTMVATLDKLNRLLGERAIHIEERDRCSQDLAGYVRYVHGNFRRLQELGEVDKACVKEFGVPLFASRESNTRWSIWRDFGNAIIRVFQNMQNRNAPELSPMLLSTDMVEQIQNKVNALVARAGEVHRVNQGIGDLQLE